MQYLEELAVAIRAITDVPSFERAQALSDRLKRRLSDIPDFAERNRMAFFAMGAAAAAALAIPIRSASRFEDAFLGVIKVTEGLGEGLDSLTEEGKKVRAQFEQLARTVPIPIEQLLRFGAVGGQLGVANENLAKFAETIARLSVSIEGIDPENAALQIARLDAVINQGRGDFDKLGSVLVELGNNFAAIEGPILSTASDMMGFAQITGQSIPQLLAWATAAQAVGAESAAVSTALQKIAIEMRKAISEGGDALEVFAKTAGLTASEFRRTFLQNSSEAIIRFIEGLKRLEGAGEDSITILDRVGLADARLIRETMKLAGGVDRLRKAMRFARQEWERNNALLEESNRRFSSLTGAMGKTRNVLDELTRKFGEPLLTPLKKAIGGLRDAAIAVVDFMDKLGPMGNVLTYIIGGVAGLVAVLSGSMLVLGFFGRAIRFISEGLAVFGINARSLLAPLRLFGRLLGLPIRLLPMLVNWTRLAAVEMGRAALATGRWAAALTSALIPALRRGAGAVRAFLSSLMLGGMGRARGFLAFLGRLVPLIGGALAGAFRGAAMAVRLFTAALISNPIGAIIAGIVGLVSILLTVPGVWEKVKGAAVAAWNWIARTWQAVPGFFSDLWQRISSALSGWWDRIAQGASQFFARLPELAAGALGGLVDLLIGPFKAALQWIADRFDLGRVLGEAIARAKDVLVKPLEAVAEFVRSFWPFSPAERGPLREIARAGVGLISEISKGIQKAQPLLERVMSQAAQAAQAGAIAASVTVAPVLQAEALPQELPDLVQRVRVIREESGLGALVAGLPTPAPAPAGGPVIERIRERERERATIAPAPQQPVIRIEYKPQFVFPGVVDREDAMAIYREWEGRHRENIGRFFEEVLRGLVASPVEDEWGRGEV